MIGELTPDTLEHLHRVVAPCRGCGAAPLTPAHRLRAREDVVCAERVADVLLMIQLILELRRPVPSFTGARREAAA